MKDIQKTWVSSINRLKISDQKHQNFQSWLEEQNKGNTRPQRQKLNMDHVTSKKKSEANLKKAFRSKLLELCKTRTRKPSPDLFTFYVILAGHDMVSDNESSTTCQSKFKAP